MQAKFSIQPIALWHALENFGKAFADFGSDTAVGSCNIHSEFGHRVVETSRAPMAALASQAGWESAIKEFQEHPYLEPKSIKFDVNPWSIAYTTDDKGSSELAVTIGDQISNNAEMVRDFMGHLAKHFTIIPRSRSGAQNLSERQSAAFEFAERTIAALATETAKISSMTSGSLEKFMAAIKQRALELEDGFQKRADELDLRSQQRQEQLDAQYAERQADLDKRESEFRESKKQFELRNNTAVRRDLLEQIKKKIEAQKIIAITPETTSKRDAIHRLCIGTLIVSVLCIAAFVAKLFVDTAFDWRVFIPLSTWTVIFVSTGIYYLKWNDQWFRDHAKVEFEDRKFSSDVLRASWVAELFFEWAEKKDIRMPPELVRSFTKNLFDPISVDGKFHPSDQLHEFLKELSTIEIGKNGAKLARQLKPEKPQE